MREKSSISETTQQSKAAINLESWTPGHTRETPWREAPTKFRRHVFSYMFGIDGEALHVGQASERYELLHLQTIDGEPDLVDHEDSWKLVAVVIHDKFVDGYLVVDTSALYCGFVPAN